MPTQRVDVVGLGLNAVDTVLTVTEFPPIGGKEEAIQISRHAGGQIATAIVTCQRLGLKTRYVGKIGDDDAGNLQLQSLRAEGIDTTFVLKAPGAPNQLGLIIVDQATGERTVFWHHDSRLAVRPDELRLKAIRNARILLIDGCDVEACLAAAKTANQAGIPVVADFDTAYSGVEKLFPLVDYLIAPHNFFPAITGHNDPVRAMAHFSKVHGARILCVTLGQDGAMALEQDKFLYSPGFVVKAVDTTGAGDVFHGAFIYGVLKRWPLGHVLEFSNAMAALNCTKLGARGGIATAAEAENLIAIGRRHRNPQFDGHGNGHAFDATRQHAPESGASKHRPALHPRRKNPAPSVRRKRAK